MWSGDYEMAEDGGYADPYPTVRDALATEYSDLPVDELEELFESIGLSAEAIEVSLGDGGTAAPSRPSPGSTRAAPGGSPAAAQLLALLSRPELIQALLAMALGTAGRRQVQVGQTPVPPAAFGNLLGSLAGRAVAEHHPVVAGRESGTPQYLLGADVDVSNPDERADRLLEVIAESEPAWSPQWSPQPDDAAEAEMWDELDLLDAAEYGDG